MESEKRVAPPHDSVPRLGKSKISRRNCELTDVSCTDIFCSVAIYDWRGWGGSDRHNLH